MMDNIFLASVFVCSIKHTQRECVREQGDLRDLEATSISLGCGNSPERNGNADSTF
jgi:hypothetical protein